MGQQEAGWCSAQGPGLKPQVLGSVVSFPYDSRCELGNP